MSTDLTQPPVTPIEVAQPPCGTEGPATSEPAGDDAPTMSAEEAAAKISEMAKSAAAKEQARGPVILAQKARIEWLREDGTVETKELCLRSFPVMFECIRSKIPAGVKDPEHESLQKKVRITVMSGRAYDRPGTPQDETVKFEGPVGQALASLAQSIMTPEEMSSYLFRQFERMSELSGLKGLVITIVADDAQIGGWAYMSALAKVTDQDKVTLAEASMAQAAMFKDKLAQQEPHLRFPSDAEKSRIIIPG